jgi:hypothetical protein
MEPPQYEERRKKERDNEERESGARALFYAEVTSKDMV